MRGRQVGWRRSAITRVLESITAQVDKRSFTSVNDLSSMSFIDKTLENYVRVAVTV
jgi:hypothetical protein